MTTQIKIRDLENNDTFGGILLNNGDAICGCCGSVFSADERGETWEIEKRYDFWVNLSEIIVEE